MRTLAFILTLALASPAFAADWLQNCTSNRTTTSVTQGGFVCFDPAANTDDSPILSVGQCDYTNWSYFDDKNGDATDCTVAFTIQGCPDATLIGSAADSGCEDLEGISVLSSTNRFEAGIASGPWLRAQAGEAGVNAGDCRIIVTCSSGAGGL